MGRLVVIRHGNTFDKGETLLRVGGLTDLPLSQSGRVQADNLARHFTGDSFDAVLCSPLLRQSQTATAILNQLAAPQVLTIEHGLTEVDYGPDEGQPEEAVIARIGADAIRRWDEDRIAPAEWKIDEAALIALWGGLLRRAQTHDIMVVTSNGTARYVFDHVERGNAPFKLRTGAFGIIESAPNGAPRLLSWNQRPDIASEA